MKKLNKVAVLFATAALATAAGAQTRVTAANGGNVIDNWQNGTGEYVWRNGTNELCWRNTNWTPRLKASKALWKALTSCLTLRPASSEASHITGSTAAIISASHQLM